MALKVNLSASQYGLAINDAYTRIAVFRGDKEKMFCTIQTYASQGARESFLSPIHTQEYMIDTAQLTGDLLPALYNWLKLQPEFADAVDC